MIITSLFRFFYSVPQAVVLWLSAIVHLAITSWQQLKYEKESLSGSGQQRRAGCTHWLTFLCRLAKRLAVLGGSATDLL